MNSNAFAAALLERFDGDLYAAHPVDRRFEKVVADIEGMSTEHSLTLLNTAVSFMGQGEWYLEVGSYRGRSLVGATLGHAHDRFVAIENFREFGDDPDRSHDAVLQTLSRWQCRERVRFYRGDAFRVLGAGIVPGPIGVYFYDGAHSRMAQYLGLAAAEPFLADDALVIVDDASWPQVASSTQAYINRHPGYELLLDLRAEGDYDSRWCNGVKVYAWRRPRAWSMPDGVDVRWRRALHLHVHEPALTFAWRTLPRYPRLSAVLKRIYLHGGSRVPEVENSREK